jgi:hypothetical protein
VTAISLLEEKFPGGAVEDHGVSRTRGVLAARGRAGTTPRRGEKRQR